MRMLLAILWVLVPALAGAEEGHAKRLTPEQAAVAVLAATGARGQGGLESLAGRDDPDPWLVADELLRRGEADAALAFARAAPRKDTEALPAYIESRRGGGDEARLRAALAEAGAALARGDPEAALTAAAGAGELPDSVTGVRLRFGDGLVLRDRGRAAESERSLLEAAGAAERIGWVRRAAEALELGGRVAHQRSAWSRALDAWGRLVALLGARGDTVGAARVQINLGLAQEALGDHALALSTYERALVVLEASGDRAAAATTLGNMGIVHRRLGDQTAELSCYERALAAQETLGDRGAVAATLGNIGNIHYRLGQFAKALSFYERVLVEQAALGDEAGAARTLGNIGVVHERRGDYAKALSCQERALEVLETLSDRAGAATTLGRIGSVHFALGDYAQALSCHERALAVMEALGDRREAAQALGNIGLVHHMLGDYGQALSCHERALAAKEAMGDSAGAAATLGNIGVVHEVLGDFATALSCYERALAVKEALGDRAGAAATLANIGHVHGSFGNYADALSIYERALASLDALGDRAGAARVRQNIGNVHGHLGDYAKALSCHERALAEQEAVGDRAGAAATLENIGIVYARLGDYAKALVCMERALAGKEALGNRAGAASVLGNIGSVHSLLGDHAWALSWHERALVAREAKGDRVGAAATLANIGNVHHRVGEHAKALSCYERALAVQEAMGDLAGVASTFYNIGNVHHALGDHRRAMEFARRSVAALGSLVRGLGAEEGAGARAPLSSAFDVGADAALAAKDAAELAFFLESGRAGALLEGLRARETLWSAAIPEALRAEELRVRATETLAQNALRQASEAGDRRAIRARRADLGTARERVSAVVARIQREAKAGAALVYPKAATLDEIRATVGVGDALLLYGLLDPDACALVLTKDDARIVGLGATAAIEGAVRALALEEPGSDPAAALTQLAQLVVDPLALPPSTRRVLVSPSGTLSYVPFAALMPDATLVYVPSGTTYRLLREEQGLRGEGVLALGDPDYETKVDAQAVALHRGGPVRLGRLPATREEAKAVGTVTLLGPEATEKRLRESLAERKRWRAVHLACHGLVNAERPELSSLALAAAGDEDGFLTCLDVFRAKVPADLVVLSACETGRGKVVRGEGLVGLTRAFMFAGSPRVICSLWKVDDEATKALMTKFYGLWSPQDGSQGLPAAEALRQAQAFVRSEERWKHPYYWAAWVLWGLPE